jgi:hypothetical protein
MLCTLQLTDFYLTPRIIYQIVKGGKTKEADSLAKKYSNREFLSKSNHGSLGVACELISIFLHFLFTECCAWCFRKEVEKRNRMRQMDLWGFRLTRPTGTRTGVKYLFHGNRPAWPDSTSARQCGRDEVLLEDVQWP